MTSEKMAKLARQHLSRMVEHLLAHSSEEGVENIKTLAISLANNGELRKNVAFLIRDFCAEHLRPEIRKFAGMMEVKLLKHDPAWGQSWKGGTMEFHLSRMVAIVEELQQAVADKHQVGLKAADLANHAMMIADIAGELEDV